MGYEASGGLMPHGLLSGGQDGIVRLWDLRQKRSAMETQVHTGAVNDLIAHKMPNGDPLVLSAGADRRVLALDPRMSLAAVHLFEDQQDFVYSLTAIGHLAISGGGDGNVLLHDLATGTTMYGLGANQAAVRAMHAETGRLVCAGDDGTVIAFEFLGDGRGPAKSNTSAVARREARLGPMNGGFGQAASQRASDLPSPAEKPRSSAEQYADKKRAAMEKAERIKAERRAKEEAARGGGGGGRSMPVSQRPAWDDGLPAEGVVPRNEFGTPLGPPAGGRPGGAQQAAQDELEALHRLGDQKFGRRR